MTAPALTRPLTTLQTIRALFAQSAYELQATFAYTRNFYLSLVTTAASYLVLFLVWGFMLARRQSVGGLAPDAMAVYLVLAAWLSMALVFRLDTVVGFRIRSGLIAVDLLKPVDFELTLLARAASHTLFQGALASLLLVGGFAVIGPRLLPAGPSALAGFAASAVLAFLVQFGIGFLFLQAAFINQRNYGMYMTRLMLHFTFSGLSAPLSAFPPALRAVAEWLPFRHVVHTPVMIWLGQTPPEAVPAILLQQVLWVAGLALAGRALFRTAMRHLSVQGG